MHHISATKRALNIEYAIRDVVVPATELEAQGHTIIKLNIGDPIAYPGLPTPSHMVEAFSQALADGRNGYSPSYGLPELREAIANDERAKGWPASADDVYVCHGVTEALQVLFQATLEEGNQVLAPGMHIIPRTWLIPKCTGLKLSNTDSILVMDGHSILMISNQR